MHGKGYLIVFIGIDGAGKTTQAQLLVNSLINRGLPAEYIWARWEPCLLKPASMLVRKIIFKRAQCLSKSISKGKAQEDIEYQAFSKMKQRIFSLPGMKLSWFYLAMMEYYFQIYKKNLADINARSYFNYSDILFEYL